MNMLRFSYNKTAARSALLKRHYHEHVVYGYRVPKPRSYPDFSPEQLKNRQTQATLVGLVNAFRASGHRATDLDPLGLQERTKVPDLDPARYGLTNMDRMVNTDGILSLDSSGTKQARLKDIYQALTDTYCGHLAYEFEHIPETAERRWFADFVETMGRTIEVDDSKRRRYYELLARSETFDKFMQKKFGQVKRYGLEGAESAIVALDELFALCNHAGIKEAVLGMPHRGRLNILIDLLKYQPRKLFHKLAGNAEFPEDLPVSGDVISHLASSPRLNYGASDDLHVTMLHNPSHLEAVNPVVAGYGRAKQMYL
ncbi:hypothetical protein EC988_004468, partial [Linderina pennispora]